MRRREFIGLVGGAAVLWPLAGRAQQSGMPLIGYFSARSPESDVPMLAAFREGLKEAGYIEGKNVAIAFRWGLGQYDRLPALAEDLVTRRVAVIVTSGGDTSALAAKAATTTIPIVFVSGGDPVQAGLVASLNRPGGNITGVMSLLGALGGKQVGLLRELVPKASIIGFLMNPNEPTSEPQVDDVQVAAREIGAQLIVLRASTERDIDAAFATLVEQRAGALILAVGALFLTQADKLIALAARYTVPVMYFRREFAAAGGLVSYGSGTEEYYRQLGVYAGRILKDEKPADLPVVQSTKFELVINLKTAKALGIVVPPTLIARADEVIE
jgi:putative tryptophan/tyrosine transport system substrate-binding protein